MVARRKPRQHEEELNDDLFEDHPEETVIEHPNFIKQRQAWLSGNKRQFQPTSKQYGTSFNGLYTWSQDLKSMTVVLEEKAIQLSYEEHKKYDAIIENREKMALKDAERNERIHDDVLDDVYGVYHSASKMKGYQQSSVLPEYIRLQHPNVPKDVLFQHYCSKEQPPLLMSDSDSESEMVNDKAYPAFDLSKFLSEKRFKVSFGYSDVFVYITLDEFEQRRSRYGTIVKEPKTVLLFKRGLEQPIIPSESTWSLSRASPTSPFTLELDVVKYKPGWWRKAFVENGDLAWQFSDPPLSNDEREINIHLLPKPQWFLSSTARLSHLEDMILESRSSRRSLRPFLNQNFLPLSVPLKDMISALNEVWRKYDVQ